MEAGRGVSVKTGFSHPQKVFSTSKRAILRQRRSDKDKLRLPLSPSSLGDSARRARLRAWLQRPGWSRDTHCKLRWHREESVVRHNEHSKSTVILKHLEHVLWFGTRFPGAELCRVPCEPGLRIRPRLPPDPAGRPWLLGGRGAASPPRRPTAGFNPASGPGVRFRRGALPPNSVELRS